MPTIQQLVRNGREQISNKTASVGLHPRVHQHPEEAELCSS